MHHAPAGACVTCRPADRTARSRRHRPLEPALRGHLRAARAGRRDRRPRLVRHLGVAVVRGVAGRRVRHRGVHRPHPGPHRQGDASVPRARRRHGQRRHLLRQSPRARRLPHPRQRRCAPGDRRTHPPPEGWAPPSPHGRNATNTPRRSGVDSTRHDPSAGAPSPPARSSSPPASPRKPQVRCAPPSTPMSPGTTRVLDEVQHECAHPGCHATVFLQYDHVRPYDDDGPTVLANLQRLCGPHNQAKEAARRGR